MGFLKRLGSLYAEERGRLFTYALSFLGDAGLSEDVVQDVFRRLCESQTEVNDLRAYVYRCVRNRSIDLIRSRAGKKHSPGPRGATSIYAIDECPAEDATLSRERAERVAEALRTLRAAEREVVVLHIYSEMTFDSIAEVLAAPLGTVTSRYQRALAKLRKALQGEMSP